MLSCIYRCTAVSTLAASNVDLEGPACFIACCYYASDADAGSHEWRVDEYTCLDDLS